MDTSLRLTNQGSLIKRSILYKNTNSYGSKGKNGTDAQEDDSLHRLLPSEVAYEYANCTSS